jgi:hypothetical protein
MKESISQKHANNTFDEKQAGEFLQVVFGKKPESSKIVLFYLPHPLSQFFVNINPLMDAAREEDASGKDVYIHVCTTKKTLPKRPSADDVDFLYAVWMDFDTQYGKQGKKLSKDKAELQKYIDTLDPRPTIVVDSGHGFHAWWCLETPMSIGNDEDRDRAAALAEKWQRAHIAAAHDKYGWQFDSTMDLARVLRLPGCHNHKGGECLPVSILEVSGRKYSVEELEAAATVSAAPATVATATVVNGPIVDRSGLKLDPQANPPEDKLAVMLDTSPRFNTAWGHSSSLDINDRSPSGYDKSLACQALAAGWTDQEVADLLIAFRRRHNLEPSKALRPDYITRTIENSRKFLTEQRAVEPVVLEDSRDTSWQTPESIFDGVALPTSTEIPGDCLPIVLQDYVEDEAPRLGVPPAALGLACLVVCSSLIPDSVSVTPKQVDTGWKENARLWGLLVGEVGAKKSPALQRAADPLKVLEEDLYYEWKQAREEYERQLANYEKLLKSRNRAYEPVKPKEPPAPRVMLDDFTVESISEVLKAESGNRKIAIVVDEISGLIASLDCYRPSGSLGKDRAALLELFGGGLKAIDRIKRGRILVPNWSACVLGGIQNDMIRNLIHTRSVADGFSERFLIGYVEKTSLLGDDRLPNYKALDVYRRAARKLHGYTGELIVGLSREARDTFLEILTRANEWTKLPSSTTAFAGHISKWLALIPRTLLTYHMVEWARGDGPSEPPEIISEETAARVRKFMLKCLLPASLRFYADVMPTSGAFRVARQIGALILARGLETVTRREIARNCWAIRSLETREDRERATAEAMTRLEMAGWVDSGHGGKWKVNPAVHVCFRNIAEKERERRAAASEVFDVPVVEE